jgi:hypothetical protein
MKNLNLILAMLMALMVQGATAQTNVYHPMPDSNAIWRVDYSTGLMVTGSTICMNCLKYQDQISGDTIIGGNAFLKIYRTGWNYNYDQNLGCNFYDLTCTINQYKGALREDTASKKVYFHDGQNQDTLLYDFTLNVGDTLKQQYNAPMAPFIVHSIDSILIGSTYRKRWNYHVDQGLPVSVIEGIGSTTGLLESLFIFEQGGNLVCFSINDTTYYPSYNSTNCQLITSGIKENAIANNQITLFPNPATTTITLHFTMSNINCQLSIEDVLGNKIYQQQITNATQATIDISTWSEGVYFYEVIGINETARGKFIKE